MDALEFLKERKRMCTSCKNCYGCPLEGTYCALSYVTPDEDYERIIATVEQWSKEHPRKTRQSVFLEQYPEAPRDSENILNVCPKCLDRNINCREGVGCCGCRREFWMREEESF